MIKTLFLNSLLLLIPALSWGQERVYFGYDANLHSELNLFDDGSYALCGSSNYNGETSVLVVLFDACGDTLWSQRFFDGLKLRKAIRLQNDGVNLWLAAGLGSNQDSAIALLKINRQGQVLLSKSITAPHNFIWYQFHVDQNQNLYFTGNSTASTGLANTVLKLNSQAQQIFAYQYNDSFIWGMSTLAPSGGLLNTTGRTIYKLDVNGNVEWTTRLNSFYQSQIPPIALSDGYLVFHKYFGALDRTGITKLDLQGNIVWTTDNILFINASSAAVRDDGHIVLAYNDYSQGRVKWGIAEFDEAGNYLKAHFLPQSTGDAIYARDIKALADSELLISGLIEFDFSPEEAISIRRLSQNLEDLEDCKATVSTLSTEESYTEKDSISPVFSPQAYNSFSIQNANFSPSAQPLNLNLFCGAQSGIELNLGPDLKLCRGEDYYLQPIVKSPKLKLYWSDGSVGDSLLITEPGLYWCEQSHECSDSIYRDSVYIDFHPQVKLSISSRPENPVPGDSIEFRIKLPKDSIYWEIGDSTYWGNPLKLVSYPSMSAGVKAYFIDSNSCLVTDTIYPAFSDLALIMPNAFTPNGDGLNDYFGPDPSRIHQFEMQIFDRFGKQQAQLRNQQWDGGQLPAGSYVYFLRYQIIAGGEQRVLRGIVNLIR